MKKILTLFIALILVAGIVSVAKSYTIDDNVWSGSATRYPKDRHIVQSSDGTIVVVYRTWNPPTDVRAAKSINNGANWYKLDGTSEGYTVLCGADSIKDQNLSICIDADDNIYLTYLQGSLGDYDVFFKKLTAVAGTWTTWTVPGTPQTVDDTNDSFYPTITREESGPTAGRVWVAYGQDDNGSNAWLRATYSDDDFVSDVHVTTVTTGGASSTVYKPAIFIRDGSPYIVYNNKNTYYLEYSVWGGSSWSGDTISDYNTHADPGYDFSVTLITNTVHVAWFDYYSTLRHTYSYNGTTNWITSTISTSHYSDDSLEDCEVSLTTDWDTDDVELWVFASIYDANPSNQYENWDIKYRKWNGSSWTSWDSVGIADSVKERHATTPFISRGHVPVAYTYDRTDPYHVEFDFSIILDETAPEAIDDLSGQYSTGDVILTWETPGDDGGSGTLPEMSGYRLDYSSVTKTWDKDDYEVWIPTNGVAPPTEVSYTVASLQDDTTWYFRIWTRDEVPNWSGDSNLATVWIPTPFQTYTWTGLGNPGDWDDTNNWSGAAGYPNAATDKAIIDLGSESINTGAVLTIGELELGSSYSGTLTLGGNFTLDSSGPWNGNLTISNANATLDLIGYNLTILGTFSNDGTLKLQGGQTLNFTNDTNSGTVEYTGNDDVAVDTYTITNVTTNYYNLTINSTGTADDVFQLGANLAMNGAGTLIVTSGVLYLKGKNITGASAVRDNIAGTIRLYGNESVFWSTNDTNSGTYEYVGDGDAAGDTYSLLDFGTTDYYNLTINSTDGVTDTFRSSTTVLTTAYNFTLSSGTFTTNDGTTDRNLIVGGSVEIVGIFNANTSTITVGGNWDSSGGTFNYNTSTVDLVGTSTSTLTGSCTFYVLVSTTSEKTVKVSSDTVIGVTNHLNFENITLRSTLDNATWYLNLSGTQDVHHVDVRDSNADDGNTIYAGCSTDSGNNTNWIFDDSILTWDGDVDTDWNEPENWNFSIVPLSTHTVIIPDGNPYDPHLTSNVIISSMTIQTGGQLYLEGYNITVSSDVYLHGSLICSSGEQITVGGSWDSSGGTFTAANSTATFNGSGSFNILSSGTTFYNLAFNNSVSTWTLTDALSCTNISVVNGTLNDAGNTVTVNGNITFPSSSNKVTSTGTWIQAANGNITGYIWGNKLGVYQINSGVTVTMSGHFAVKKLVMQANSTLSGSGKAIRTFPVANDFWDIDNTASVTLNALADNEGAAFTQKGLSPATFNVNRINIEVSNTGTLTLTGNWNIPNTDIRVLRINGICTLDTSSYDVTAKGLYVGYVANNYNGKLDLGSGTHDVEGLGLYPGGALASNEIDLDSCNISVGGNVDFTGVTVTPGTSTVTFDGTGTSTLTGSTTFYILVSTSTKTIRVSSDTVIGVTNHLNFENITLRSTLDNATWYLNLSGTQDVSNVDVRDSNASGGDTIIDFDCPDIESCYYGNNTNWDFGPPAAITDLTGLCDSDTGNVTLSWSTPGDDEWTGVLSSTSEYRIDYSTDSSRQWDKDTYEVSIPTYGVTPNTEVSRIITGLTGDTTWYFRIWTADEIPRWSSLSNGATVWVNPILSVSISTNAYDFGDVPLGQSTHTVSVITVTNDGNVNETYSLKISSVTLYDNSPSLWKSTNTTTGHNRFIFYAIFHATQVSTSNFDSDDYVIDENRASTADWFSDNDGGGDKQTGINVPKGDERKIWFRLDMPTSTTTGKEEKITVTITAGPE